MKLLISFIFLILSLQGCASFTYTAHLDRASSHPPFSHSTLEERSNRYEWSDLDDIAVYVDEFPAGISDINGEYVIQTDGIEKIGLVTVKPKHKNKFTIFFDDYAEDENWRNSYCPVQGVLYWTTCTLWAVTPFPWPCFVYESDESEDISDRRTRIINTLKKMAKAAGGNAIVITKFGDSNYDSELEGIFIGYGNLKMTSAEALILKVSPEVKKIPVNT